MTWLFVSAAFPWPLAHGTWLRIYHLARTLAAAGESVSLLAPAPTDPRAAEAYRAVGVRLADGPVAGLAEAPRRGLYPIDPAMREAVRRGAAEADVAVLVHARTLAYAADAADAGCVAADLVDDLILEERRKLWREWAPRTWARRVLFLHRQRRWEREHLPAVDVTTFVSDADAAGFARRHRRRPVAVVPNGVDADVFAPPANPPTSERPTILFLGNLVHPPNADAAEYLLREVAPRVRAAEPSARVVILGASPPAAVTAAAEADDVVTGFVEDVRPALWAADAVVLPMRLGTGVKNKLLEAWAAGKAVAATSLACQGAPAKAGENLLVADTAAGLADAAVRLLRDEALRRRLGRAGRTTVREKLSWSAAADALRRACQKGRK